jgi:DNA-binding helix-hairpin-helix protein with protein kinase domain
MSAARQNLEAARQKKIQVLSRITEEENKEVSKVQERLRGKVGEVSKRRRKLADQETSELQQINGGVGKQLNAAQADLARIDNDQAAELSAALTNVQGDFIQQFLHQFDIQTASISGIGTGYKSKLRAAGVFTAADVDYRVHRIHGIGTVKAASLFAWRLAYEQSARTRMPQSLDLSEQQKIQNKYSARRQAIQQQVMGLQAMRQKQEEAVKQRYIALRVPLDREEAEIHRATTEDMQRVRSKFADASSKAATRENQFISAHEKLTIERKKLADEAELDRSQIKREYERLRRRLAIFDNITFRRFVVRVFTGR